MKKLVIIRHAKSSWDVDPSSLHDFDRPLSPRGLTDAPLMGRHLAAAVGTPDLICPSTSIRAFNTALLIAKEVGYTRKVIGDRGIYFDGEGSLLATIRSFDHISKKMGWGETGLAFVVGHNPDLTRMVNLLTGSSIENVPTCGVVVVSLDIERWSDIRAGTIEAFYVPRDLR